MSSSFSGGQIFGAVIGAIAGVAIAMSGGLAAPLVLSYASMGLTIGMTAGGIIDPPPQQTITQEGPRLGDLTTQTSEWGIPIRRLFGTFKLSSNIIWSQDLKETKHVEESGDSGKGGGGGTKTETITYTYSASWASAFCEGSVSGITKIWFDSVLVYDGTNYASGLLASNHTVYLGTDSQPIDWYMQSIDPDTPAYRHVSYIMFRDIQLENYGNKIPRVSVEISKNSQYSPIIQSNSDVDYHWYSFSNILLVDENQIINTMSARFTNNYTDVHYAYGRITNYGDFIDFSEKVYFSSPHMMLQKGQVLNKGDALIFEDRSSSTVDLYLNGDTNSLIKHINMNHWTATELYSFFYSIGETESYLFINYTNELLHINGLSVNTITTTLGDISTAAQMYYYNEYVYIETITLTEIIIHKYDKDLNYIEELRVDVNWGFQYLPQAAGLFQIDDYGFHIFREYRYVNLSFDLEIHKNMTINTYVGTGGLIAQFYYKNNFLYKLYDGQGSEFEDLVNYEDSKFQIEHLNSISISQVSVGSISQELLLRAGLDQNDIDVTEGVDLVHGYVIPSQMDTRAAIASLISAYDFSLIENDFTLTLKKRNLAIIDSIPEEDIIKFAEIERRQTVELHRRINIAYANKDNNYSAGIQSAIRNDSNSDNTAGYQFALALSDNEAKALAEKFIFSEWNERIIIRLSVSSKYIDLIVTNTISVTYKDAIFNIRITKIDFVTNSQLNIEGSLENIEGYTFTGEGSDTGSVNYEVAIKLPTKLQLLDLPMLDNAYNESGIYLSTSGYNDSWVGCAIHASNDNLTYYKTRDSLSKSTIGIAITALPDGISYAWDYNEVTIKLNNDSLYSVSENEVLSAKNYISIGNEVLQYTTATDNLDGTFTLSKLLRGRRGTEWAMNSHVIGDVFALLTNQLIFENFASFNVKSYYKATTFGLYLDDSEIKEITPEMRNLKPLSPSYIRGSRDGTNNLTISWMRRSRDVTGFLKTLQLYEETESYEIDILDSGDNIVATKTSITNSFVYSDADQLIDIPAHVSGDPVKIVIYQISGIVQRGYGSEATI